MAAMKGLFEKVILRTYFVNKKNVGKFEEEMLEISEIQWAVADRTYVILTKVVRTNVRTIVFGHLLFEQNLLGRKLTRHR